MGGLTFTHPTADGQPGLLVPRMSPTTYAHLKTQYHDLLESLFTHVTTPPEAPGKPDYGDIDFLVCGMRQARRGDWKQDLRVALNAERVSSCAETTSFAVRRCNLNIGSGSACSREVGDDGRQVTGASVPSYVQIDVHLCSSVENLTWQRFKTSYGDLGNIIGVFIRPLGFTAHDTALHVRIPEVEESHAAGRKECRLLLTSSPSVTMEFLGLDCTRYDAGFSTEEELFRWVTASRWFSRKLFEESKTTKDKRKEKRPMFQRFVKEWLPAHPDTGDREPPARETLLQMALDRFEQRTEYVETVARHRAKQREKAFWSDVAALLRMLGQHGDHQGLAIRALKRWVQLEPGSMPVISELSELDDEKRSAWTAVGLQEEELISWVKQNWEVAVLREKDRVKREAEARKRLREEAEMVSPNNALVIDQGG